jgi:hypothetical protein
MDIHGRDNSVTRLNSIFSKIAKNHEGKEMLEDEKYIVQVYLLYGF